MTFVDTGAQAAFFVPRDPLHTVAVEWMGQNDDPLITTDYVLDEVVTLIKTRLGVAAAVAAGEQLWAEEYSQVLYLGRGHPRSVACFPVSSGQGMEFHRLHELRRNEAASNFTRLRLRPAFFADAGDQQSAAREGELTTNRGTSVSTAPRSSAPSLCTRRGFSADRGNCCEPPEWGGHSCLQAGI